MLFKFFITYLILVNAAGFAVMLIDKRRAIRGVWRIPEATLLGIALLGGSIGTIAGMNLFRHKTRHPRFFIGLPAILALQIIFSFVIFLKL